MPNLSIRTTKDIKHLEGVRVLLRVDANVPLDHGIIRDDFRLRKMTPMLKELKEAGAKTLLLSHRSDDLSLDSVAEYLNKAGFSTHFVPTIATAKEAFARAGKGSFVLLENLRRFAGEEGNDDAFAKEISAMGELYINEAFSASHRSHASIVGIPKYLPAYAGRLFEQEMVELSQMFTPEHPFLFILGGAKFDTKLPLVSKFLSIADTIFIGGALANDILKAKGYNVGSSMISDLPEARELAQNQKVVVPTDVRVRETEGDAIFKVADRVRDREIIIDAGEKTMETLRELVKSAATVLWNGPLGKYEDPYGSWGTEALAKIVAEHARHSVIGGGDTLAAVAKLGLYNSFTFVSSGGGAMLDFLANETLPGIEALKKSV